MKTIAIVGGTGPEGSGLALRWARAGEHVVIGSRDEQRACNAAEKIATRAGITGRVEGKENKAAVTAAEIVVLTIPFEAHAAMLKHIKPALKKGTLLIDASVPLAASVGGRATRTLGVWQGSVAQQAAELAPEGVPVVAAFQNVSAMLLEGEDAIQCDVIVCGDDEHARAAACELAEKIPGLRGIDGGKLENARIVEQITALLITLNIRHKVHGAGLRITGIPPAGSRDSSH